MNIAAICGGALADDRRGVGRTLRVTREANAVPAGADLQADRRRFGEPWPSRPSAQRLCRGCAPGKLRREHVLRASPPPPRGGYQCDVLACRSRARAEVAGEGSAAELAYGVAVERAEHEQPIAAWPCRIGGVTVFLMGYRLEVEGSHVLGARRFDARGRDRPGVFGQDHCMGR